MDHSWNSIEYAQWAIKQWADKNFPERTAHSALCKLMLHEIPEFAMSQKDPLEYADLLILIFDIATLNGIDIPKALNDKMEINYARQWDWDPATGMAQHVPEEDDVDPPLPDSELYKVREP